MPSRIIVRSIRSGNCVAGLGSATSEGWNFAQQVRSYLSRAHDTSSQELAIGGASLSVAAGAGSYAAGSAVGDSATRGLAGSSAAVGVSTTGFATVGSTAGMLPGARSISALATRRGEDGAGAGTGSAGD